jgi:hypothetical protein
VTAYSKRTVFGLTSLAIECASIPFDQRLPEQCSQFSRDSRFMKTLRCLIASPLLLVILSSVTNAQSNQRENFELKYWDSYVGSYQTPSNQFIVIGLVWNKRLSYLNTETGVFGTLEESGKDFFFGKDDLTIRFTRREDGDVNGLRWKSMNGNEVTGNVVNLRFEHIKIPNGNITLGGTLILPATEKPHPAIILNGRASWIVREQVLEDALINASHGIAALIYDKRGFGNSSGEQTVPFSESANDIVAIAKYLQFNRTDLNPRQIGISTYSQSGWCGTLTIVWWYQNAAVGKKKHQTILLPD